MDKAEKVQEENRELRRENSKLENEIDTLKNFIDKTAFFLDKFKKMSRKNRICVSSVYQQLRRFLQLFFLDY